MIKYVRFLLLSLTMLLLPGCKGCKTENCNDPADPQCPNYDSCLQYRDLSAEFTMKEILVIDGNRRWEVETDTCLTANLVKFSVSSKGLDSVKWLIGSQVLQDTVVYRKGFPDGVHVPITLIAYFKSHAGCSNNQSGIDTVTKYLYGESNPWDLPVNGVYEGVNIDAPGDRFTIQVNDTTTNTNIVWVGGSPPVDKTPYMRSGSIQQLPKGAPDNDIYGNRYYAFGGKAFFYDEARPADYPVADARSNFFMTSRGILKNGVITIWYTYDDNGLSNYLYVTKHVKAKDVSKTFVGRWMRSY